MTAADTLAKHNVNSPSLVLSCLSLPLPVLILKVIKKTKKKTIELNYFL